MLYQHLPWLSDRLGKPAWLAIEPLVDLAGDGATRPAPGDYVIPTEWPSTSLLSRIPKTIQGADCFADLNINEKWINRLDWEMWADQFLSSVTGTKVEEISLYGADRGIMVKSLLRAWGWTPDEHGEFDRLPTPAIADAIRIVAAKTKRLPSELVQMPFPEFVFNFRMLTHRRKGAPTTNEAAEMLEEIGIEE